MSFSFTPFYIRMNHFVDNILDNIKKGQKKISILSIITLVLNINRTNTMNCDVLFVKGRIIVNHNVH